MLIEGGRVDPSRRLPCRQTRQLREFRTLVSRGGIAHLRDLVDQNVEPDCRRGFGAGRAVLGLVVCRAADEVGWRATPGRYYRRRERERWSRRSSVEAPRGGCLRPRPRPHWSRAWLPRGPSSTLVGRLPSSRHRDHSRLASDRSPCRSPSEAFSSDRARRYRSTRRRTLPECSSRARVAQLVDRAQADRRHTHRGSPHAETTARIAKPTDRRASGP